MPAKSGATTSAVSAARTASGDPSGPAASGGGAPTGVASGGRRRTVLAAARAAQAKRAAPTEAATPDTTPTSAGRVPGATPAARRWTVLPDARAADAAPPAGRATDAVPSARGPRPIALPPARRILCWQVVLVLAAVAVGRPWPLAVALGGTAAVLLAVSAIRVRRTWLSTLLARWLRLLLRRRSYQVPTADRPRALLAWLAPGARIRTVELGGAPAAVVSRPEELVAVLRPDRATARDLARIALAEALLPDADGAAPRLALRLVLHRGPRQEQLRGWLALRALRDVDAAADEALRVALGNASRRLLRRVRRTDLDLVPLTEAELLGTVPALTHVGAGRDVLRERWRNWRAGAITQVGLRLSGPTVRRADRVAALDRLLAAVPEVATTVVLAADTPELAGVLRLAANTPEAVDAAVDRLAVLGPAFGVRLDRLDGRHGPAVAVSLLIGGDLA